MRDLLRILMVEDVPTDAVLVKRELQNAGISFTAECVETEEDFRERLQSFHPDIILSDYSLPLFSGMKALQITQEVNPLIPFIVVTGSMNELTAVACMKAGASDYVIKEHLSRLGYAVQSELESAETRRRNIEIGAALKESEERFRTLYENSTIGLYRTTPDGNIVLANPTLVKLLGYATFEELTSRNLEQEGYASSYERNQYIKQVEILGEIYGLESAWIHRDGSIIYVRESARAIRDSRGKTLYYDGSVEDITERKNAERELRLTEQRFRLVWDNAADGIRLTDRNGLIIDVNPAYSRMVKISREELLGRVFSVAYQSEGPDDDLSLYHRRFEESETVTNLFGSATLWNGESIDLHISSSFIEKAGQEKLLLSLFRDVTEKRKTEKLLENERNLLRTIIETIPDEILVKDLERRFVIANSRTMNALKLSSFDQILGKKEEELIPEHLAKETAEEEHTILAVGGKAVTRIANKFDPETGAIQRSLMVSKVPLKDSNGQIIGLVGINRDVTALKRAEEMLEKERSLLFTIIENIPDEVCLKDPKHRFLVANRAVFTALGARSMDDLLGKTDLDFVTSELAQEHFVEEDRVIETGEPLINRERIRRDPVTGAITKCLLTTKVLVKDPAGKKLGVLIINRYITDRKQAEEALQKSMERYKNLTLISPVGIFHTDENGLTTYVNPRWCEISGLSFEDALGNGWLSAVHPDDKVRLFNGWQAAAQLHQSSFSDYRFVRPDGTITWVMGQAIPETNAENQIVGYIGIITDITERKRSEEALLAGEEKYRTIFENVQDVYYEASIDGTILEVSPSIEIISKGQYHRNELLGKSMYDFYTNPEERQALLLALQNQGSVTDFEVTLQNRDGSQIPCSISSKIYFEAEGHSKRIIGSMRDISARKRSEHVSTALFEFSKAVNLTDTLESLYVRIHEILNSIILARNFFVALIDDTGKELVFPYQVDVNPIDTSPVISIDDSQSLTAEVIHSKKPLLLNEEGLNERYASGKSRVWITKPKCWMGVPLLLGERVIGVMVVQDYSRSEIYTNEDILIFSAAAQQVALAIHRKQAEVELRESDQRFKELFDKAPVGYHEIDLEGRVICVNRTEMDMLGYTEEEMVGQYVWKYVADEESSKQRVLAKLRGSINLVTNFENIFRRKDGSTFPVLSEDRFIVDSTGITKGLRTTVQDITKRKEAERELGKSNAFKELLLNTIPFGLDIVDEQGTILFANKALKSISESGLIGKRCWQVYRDDRQQCQDCPLRTDIIFDRTAMVEVSGVFGGKTVQIIHIGIAYEGKPAMLEVFQDVTEQRKLLSHMHQVQKMESIGTLAGGIAHDFNNILGIIMAYTHILTKLPGREQHELLRSSIDGIQKATDRGAALVRQILTFARRTDTTLEPVSVNMVVKELAGMLGETFPKTVVFNLNLEKTVPVVMMDHNQLHQALLNLCVNARDAMEENGELSICTRLVPLDKISKTHPEASAAHYVSVEVTDTGSGMDESIKNRIFEPFFTTKELGKGTGLGLSVVYGAVVSHHGFIDVETSPGHGTSFFLYFPVPEGIIQDRKETVGGTQTPGGSETILVVEDEEVLAKIMNMVLKEAGYTVLIARDGVEGLQIFEREQGRIDAVISDVGLPRMKGTAMLQAILERKPDTKIIMASGFMEPGFISDLFVRGAKDFIHKPYDPADVLKKLREVLDEGKP